MPELLVQQILQAVQTRPWIRRVEPQVVGKVARLRLFLADDRFVAVYYNAQTGSISYAYMEKIGVRILIMRDDFREPDYTEELLPVLDHLRAQRELGASVFWTRVGAVLLETVDEFVAHWQVKRDLSRRGIVEVVSEAMQ